MEALQAIRGKTSPSSNLALIIRNQKLLQNKEHWVIRHIPREASRIVKMINVITQKVHVLLKAFIELLGTFDSDKINDAFNFINLI